jgi:hypothetical protein
MNGYPSGLINDEKASIGVVVKDFNGAGGDGRFVTVDGVGNTISVLDFVVDGCGLAVDFDRVVFYCCLVVFRLTVPEFRTKNFEERDIMPPQLGPGMVCLSHQSKIHQT